MQLVINLMKTRVKGHWVTNLRGKRFFVKEHEDSRNKHEDVPTIEKKDKVEYGKTDFKIPEKKSDKFLTVTVTHPNTGNAHQETIKMGSDWQEKVRTLVNHLIDKKHSGQKGEYKVFLKEYKDTKDGMKETGNEKELTTKR